jgi:hypothetical protein
MERRDRQCLSARYRMMMTLIGCSDFFKSVKTAIFGIIIVLNNLILIIDISQEFVKLY